LKDCCPAVPTILPDCVIHGLYSIEQLPTIKKKCHGKKTATASSSAMSMGEVVITELDRGHKKRMVMYVTTISVNDKTPTPAAQHNLKVYPNPIQAGSTMHIEWNKKEYGNHSLQLFSQTGQLVFRKDIYIDQEARILGIDLPPVLAGSYFLRITNEQTNKSYSEKIIIQ
jgi:type IX secretion system substrate protein